MKQWPSMEEKSPTTICTISNKGVHTCRMLVLTILGAYRLITTPHTQLLDLTHVLHSHHTTCYAVLPLISYQAPSNPHLCMIPTHSNLLAAAAYDSQLGAGLGVGGALACPLVLCLTVLLLPLIS